MSRKAWVKVGVPAALGVAVLAIIIGILLPILRAREREGITIGCITPLSGEWKSYGNQTKQGIDLAVTEINSSGGINGKKLFVRYEDDQMVPRAAASAIEKLTTVSRVPAIIGAFASSCTLAIAPIAEREKVVLLSAGSTADAIKDAGDYVFRNVPTNAKQARMAADFCVQNLHCQRAAILCAKNDYGINLADEFSRCFSDQGGKIVAREAYNTGTHNFNAALAKIKACRPDVVYYPGFCRECGYILRGAREIGLNAVFIAGDSVAREIVKTGGDAANGTYYTAMAMGHGAAAKEFRRFSKAFRAKYGDEPEVYSAYAYDALKLLADAIQRGGNTADGIKKALYATKGFNGVTGPNTFDKDGEVDKPYYVYVIRNRKSQLVNWNPRGNQKTRTEQK